MIEVGKIKKILIAIYELVYKWKMIIKDWFVRIKLGKPTVLSMDETIEYIKNNHCSISRYGDGEFKIVTGEKIRFQEYDPLLARRLADILREDSNYLVCISNIFGSLDWMEKNHLNTHGELLQIIEKNGCLYLIKKGIWQCFYF